MNNFRALFSACVWLYLCVKINKMYAYVFKLLFYRIRDFISFLALMMLNEIKVGGNSFKIASPKT